jgi:hypothetical protein
MEFLVKNNLLPYIAMIIMGYFMFDFWEKSIVAKQEAANAKASSHLANENIGTVTGYFEERLDKIEKLKSEEWREGKHEKIIYYNIK